VSTRELLVIDDDDDIRTIVAMSLEMVGGYRVRSAASGAEGVAAAVAERPDAILLDVMMPDMDGPATFRKLQESEATSDIPVVLLAARLPVGADDPYGDLGVVGVIAKPFDVMTLPDQIATTLGWKQ
jgi:CheY-like chemotaxis protein